MTNIWKHKLELRRKRGRQPITAAPSTADLDHYGTLLSMSRRPVVVVAHGGLDIADEGKFVDDQYQLQLMEEIEDYLTAMTATLPPSNESVFVECSHGEHTQTLDMLASIFGVCRSEETGLTDCALHTHLTSLLLTWFANHGFLEEDDEDA